MTKVTATLRAEIRRAAKRACRQGTVKEIELGERECSHAPKCPTQDCTNSLHWDWDESDLRDSFDLKLLKEISEPCLLDCYCYDDDGLIDNVYIAVANGHVVAATDDDLNSTAYAWMAIDAASAR